MWYHMMPWAGMGRHRLLCSVICCHMLPYAVICCASCHYVQHCAAISCPMLPSITVVVDPYTAICCCRLACAAMSRHEPPCAAMCCRMSPRATVCGQYDAKCGERNELPDLQYYDGVCRGILCCPATGCCMLHYDSTCCNLLSASQTAPHTAGCIVIREYAAIHCRIPHAVCCDMLRRNATCCPAVRSSGLQHAAACCGAPRNFPQEPAEKPMLANENSVETRHSFQWGNHATQETTQTFP